MTVGAGNAAGAQAYDECILDLGKVNKDAFYKPVDAAEVLERIRAITKDERG